VVVHVAEPCDSEVVPVHVMDAGSEFRARGNRATSGSRPLGRPTFRVALDGGVGAPLGTPTPTRCYLTVTQPYMLKNAKCGVMLHRIR
jgi:hypothetical protein